MDKHIERISELHRDKFTVNPTRVIALPQSGSPRTYFRLLHQNSSTIGAYNVNIQENRAFFYLSNHFLSKGLNVPEVLAISNDEKYYLQSDLGSVTLFDTIAQQGLSLNTETILRNTVAQLALFQAKGAEGLDASRCFPVPFFDRRSVMWDLNYFKYCFLKPTGLPVDEVRLENEFNLLADILLAEDLTYFHYRDFQSRNIMLSNNALYFIDFQGGRLGPCLYDMASFLYQAKINLPPGLRENLFNFYIDELSKYRNINRNHSVKVFPVMVMFRILQTLGAYGLRGLFEKKSHFVQSIPMAVNNLVELMELPQLKDFSYIPEILKSYTTANQDLSKAIGHSEGLTVDISSFSFKNGYPNTHPEHGGGFVFDCRLLPNPGRIDKYKALTGLDAEVIRYLDENPDVQEFCQKTLDIVASAVNNYRQRGFRYISVAYGCTGGQHRSVYCANYLGKKLSALYGVNITVNHRELGNKL